MFNGLDTFTDIRFCNQPVATTNNQFRQYYFDVSDIHRQCSSSPVLSINFGSAPQIANQIAADPGQESEHIDFDSRKAPTLTRSLSLA